MSPHHALLSLVMLPSSQSVSSVGQGLCYLCMHRPHEDVLGSEWCMGMPPPPPPLFTSYTIFLFSCMSPHHALLSLVMLPSSQQGVGSVGQGLCWLCMHRLMRTLWVRSGAWECTSPVHFLDFISLLVYVSPPRASLPCHASFLAARSGCGWARGVLAVHAPAA